MIWKHASGVARRVALLVMAGTALSVGGCPGTPEEDGLAGSWRGDVEYQVAIALGSSAGNSYTFTQPFAVTFTVQGQPDTVDLALGNGEEVFAVPATDLLDVGDTAYAEFKTTNANTGEVTTTGIELAVVSIERKTASFEMELDVSVAFSGASTGTLAGTYRVSATVRSDGKLAWTGTSDLGIGDGSLGLALQVTGSGLLSRQ